MRLEDMFSDDMIRTGLNEGDVQFPIKGVANSIEDYVRKFGLIRDEIIENMCKNIRKQFQHCKKVLLLYVLESPLNLL